MEDIREGVNGSSSHTSKAQQSSQFVVIINEFLFIIVFCASFDVMTAMLNVFDNDATTSSYSRR